MAPPHMCLHETLFLFCLEKRNKQQHSSKYLLHVKIYVEEPYGTLKNQTIGSSVQIN